MNKIIFLIVCLFFICASRAGAQTNNHPTIDSVKMSYTQAPRSTSQTSAGMAFMGIPHGMIKLKNAGHPTRIYFTIKDIVTSTVYYQAGYSLSSAPILAADGTKLFENVNGRIFISSGQALPIKPYDIKVQTGDSLQNLSPVFIIIQ